MSVILTFLVGLVGGFVPAVNVELYLLALIAATASPDLAALVIAASLGQVTANTAWYMAGAGAVTLPFPAAKCKVDRLRAASIRHPRLGTVVLITSATLGLPPFAITSVASGMARIGVPSFLTVGLAGRMLRFAFVVLVPGFVRGTWPLGGGPA